MAQITAAQVKDLRDKTGAGMMDCKKALTETEGDLESAVDWLRKKGLAAAANKAERVAAEGLIGLVLDGKRGVLVEVNSETDFVARNDGFQAFVRQAADLALGSGGDLEPLLGVGYPDSDRTVAEELAFTLYKDDPYGPANLIGHYLKIVSFYLIYRAIIRTGLTQPRHGKLTSLRREAPAIPQARADVRF